MLVVDADDTRASTLVAALAPPAFRTHRAGSVSSAAAQALAAPVDCVVVDVDDPAAGGLAGLDRLRSAHAGVAVVVLVADAALGESALRVGAQDFLVKDRLDAEIVRRAVRHAIEQRRWLDHEAAVNGFVERLLDTGLDGVWIGDEAGTTVFVNAALARLVEVPRENLVGKPFTRWVHPRDRAKAVAAFEQARRGEPRRLTLTLDTRTRGPVDVFVSTAPAIGPSGRFEGAIALVTDLAERELTAAALAAAHHRYRALTEHLSDMLVVLDGRFTVVFASETTARTLGRSAAELVGTNAFEWVHPEDRVRAEPRLRLLGAGETGTVRVRARQGDGEWRWLEGIACNLTHDPAIGGVVVSLHDVTGRVDAELDAERLAAIVASSHDAIFSVDLDGMITSWNAASEQLFGYRAEDIVGRHVSLLSPPGSLGVQRETLAEAYAGRAVEHVVVSGRRADGLSVPVSARVSPVRDRDGRVVGASAIVRDVSAEVRAAAAAEAAERHFHRLFADSPAPQWMVDLDGTFLAVNPAFCALVGRDEEWLVGRTISDISNDAQQVAVSQRLRDLRDGVERLQFERTFTHADASVVDALVHVSLLRDENGVPWRALASAVDISARKRAEEALRRSEELLRSVLANMPAGVIVTDLDGTITFADGTAITDLGGSGERLRGANAFERYGQVEGLADALRRALRGQQVELTVSYGGRIHSDRLAPLRDATGAIAGSILVAVDVTDQARAAEALRRSEALLRAVVQHGSDLVAVVDRSGVLRYLSPSIGRLLGWDVAQVLGTAASETVHPDDLDIVMAAFRAAVHEPDSRQSFEYRSRAADGTYRHLRATAINALDVPELGGIVINAHDVTEQKAVEAALAHQAMHDALTDLPNRALFLDRLERALVRARRDRRHVAVLFVDVDRFKNVNDSLGHGTGDEVLVAVARSLSASLRAGDTIARLGGDEFAICCEDVDAGDLDALARRVHDALAAPVRVHGRELYVTASIGIALSGPAGGDTPESLLRDADIALYRAKERGRARHELFDEELRLAAERRLDIETGLRRALAGGELRVHYQPEVDLLTGEIVAVESLVRWQHPERGLLQPAEFVAQAEESGLIGQLGEWVLAHACADAARIPHVVSVNLSARQLADDRVVDAVADVLARTGLDPARLCLEVTETAVMADAARNAGVLARLKDLGVSLAIDDFGTGYSSLAYLKRFPVDWLKIDRSFVDGVGTEAEDTAIVDAIITLAHSIGVQVVAEGVETETQRAALATLGCDVGQGYLWSAAVPLDELAG